MKSSPVFQCHYKPCRIKFTVHYEWCDSQNCIWLIPHRFAWLIRLNLPSKCFVKQIISNSINVEQINIILRSSLHSIRRPRRIQVNVYTLILIHITLYLANSIDWPVFSYSKIFENSREMREKWKLTWVKVVRCRRRAGVGQEAADGLWRCELPTQLFDPPPPPGPTPPSDELSDFSFLKAPSGPAK